MARFIELHHNGKARLFNPEYVAYIYPVPSGAGTWIATAGQGEDAEKRVDESYDEVERLLTEAPCKSES